MTREQAIKWLKTFRGRYGMNELEDAVEMAIKALEAEGVLDKIRAEIENNCGLAPKNHCRYCSYCNSLMGVREIMEIIDKYRK